MILENTSSVFVHLNDIQGCAFINNSLSNTNVVTLRENSILFYSSSFYTFYICCYYRGADKSLARQGRIQVTATEDFDFHISYL
jgi:hypothetical protein